MTTTKTLKVNQNFDRLLKCRANGYYDYVDVVIPTNDTKNINVEMQKYDGLKYTIDRQSGAGTTIIDFSDTVLPWKFEMNNYLARTKYCWKPYRETPYQVEILEPKYNNISIVGSPMINSDIVSGFSSSNYLTLNNSLVSKNNATYVFKVTLPSSMSSNQCIFERDYFANLEFRSATQDFRAWNWQTDQYEQIATLELGKTYWFKMVIDGDVKTYSYSEDGIDYTTAYTMNDNGTNTTTGNFYIGITSRLGNIFQGSIDLSECYVKLNEIVAEGSGELIESEFTQPTLSANGTMGGSSFAVTADNETNGNNPAYLVFDNNSDTYWRGANVPGYIEFYNPAPINVTALTWGFFYSYPTSGNVQGSNDYSDWTTITEFTNDSDSDFTIDMSENTNSYKYYRINVLAVNMDVIHCSSLSIVGTVKGYAVENNYNLSNAIYVKQWNLNKVGDVQVSDDGVISNFSNYNYASISDVHINTGEELILKFTTGDDISTQQNIFTSNYDLYIAGGNLCNWNQDAYKDELVFSGVQANTTYWIKYNVTAEKEITVGVSLNGVDYEYTTYTNTTLEFSDNANMDLGTFTGDTRRYFRGSIDFANSIIPMSGGMTITEELYGIIDENDFSIIEPFYCCYANRDKSLLLRKTRTEKMDTTDWYLGEVKLFEPGYDLDV